MKKTIAILFTLLAFLGAFYFFLYPKFEIISGYNAKILCSCIFVTGLDQDTAEDIDLGFGPLWLASNTVDLEKKTVHSSVWGMHSKVAAYREGLGCTLLNKVELKEVKRHAYSTEKISYSSDIWPEKTIKPKGELAEAIKSAFDQGKEQKLNTRAVLVLKNGSIIGEQYAEGFDSRSKLLGWSMMKSVNAAMVGLLVQDGRLQLDEAAPIEEWQNDERSDITLRHLLNMTSGLDWEEDYGTVSTATVMLYGSDNMGEYAAQQALAHKPGEHWYYSSGTSNILAKIVADAFPTKYAYWDFAHERLFGPLGMRDFVAETDASGTYVGSSYGYGSARDWAKFALLFANNGNWGGQQLLDSSYVDFCRKATETSQGRYGGQFWTNGDGRLKFYSAADYWLDGFQGQQVLIHPVDDLIVVRLGVMYDESDFDFDQWIGQIIQAARNIEVPESAFGEGYNYMLSDSLSN